MKDKRLLKFLLFFYCSSRVSSSFKQNASFVSRLPTIRRHKSTSLHSPNLYKSVHPSYSNRGNVTRGFTDFISSAENLGKLIKYIQGDHYVPEYILKNRSSENNVLNKSR